MELANDANKKRMRDGKKEPKSVTIVRKVHGIQQSLIMRRLPINVVENDMAGNTLMSMTIPLLTPTLWDDVVEERSVGGVCGYPFCKNQIAILKKKRRKYGVSLKKAELLNIEGRDAFCSTSCWKASKVLHASLSKVSPQLRDMRDHSKKTTQQQNDRNEKFATSSNYSKEPSNLISALKIVEKDLSNAMPPTPPIILRDEQDMIEGFRVKRPPELNHDKAKTNKNTNNNDNIVNNNLEDELMIVSDNGDMVTSSTENSALHLRMVTLVNQWYTDVTRSFLKNSIRVPLKGRDKSELFLQRSTVLYQMLCQRKQIVTNLKIDSASLNDDISCMIATFQLNTSIPALNFNEIKEILRIMLQDLASAAWQEERGVEMGKKGNIVVKFVDDDNSNSTIASDSNVVNNNNMVLNDDGAFVHLKKSTITTPDNNNNNNNTKNNNGSVRNNNNNSKLYRNVIYDGSKEEIIHISPINSNLYNTPGRAGAIALGTNKNTRRRKMKKIITQDGKYPLGYGL